MTLTIIAVYASPAKCEIFEGLVGTLDMYVVWCVAVYTVLRNLRENMKSGDFLMFIRTKPVAYNLFIQVAPLVLSHNVCYINVAQEFG